MDIFNARGSCDAAHDLVGLDPKSLFWGWCLAFLEVNLQLSNSFLHERRENSGIERPIGRKIIKNKSFFWVENSMTGD